MQKKKGNATTALLFLIFLIGTALLLYPSVSNWWNSQHQSRAIASYSEVIQDLDEDKITEFLAGAESFNELIRSKKGFPYLHVLLHF